MYKLMSVLLNWLWLWPYFRTHYLMLDNFIILSIFLLKTSQKWGWFKSFVVLFHWLINFHFSFLFFFTTLILLNSITKLIISHITYNFLLSDFYIFHFTHLNNTISLLPAVLLFSLAFLLINFTFLLFANFYISKIW